MPARQSVFHANRDFLVAGLVSFVSGYVVSNTKVRFDTYGGMMTGNVVQMGMAAQENNWTWVGIYFLCITNFMCGVMLGLHMLPRLGSIADPAIIIFMCGIFILVDGIDYHQTFNSPDGDRMREYNDVMGPPQYNIWSSLASTLVPFALGMTNIISLKADVIKNDVTFLSNNIQKLGIAMYNGLTVGLTPAEKRDSLILFSNCFCYIFGGVSGARMGSLWYFHWSLSIAGILYLPMMRLAVVYPKQPPAFAGPFHFYGEGIGKWDPVFGLEVVLEKPDKDAKLGVTLSGEGHPFLDDVASNGLAYGKLLVGDQVLSVNEWNAVGHSETSTRLKQMTGVITLRVLRPPPPGQPLPPREPPVAKSAPLASDILATKLSTPSGMPKLPSLNYIERKKAESTKDLTPEGQLSATSAS
ncbi:hypothetical protein Ctob_014464 [Chrysochromulina tobinii]|uniref:PDZ domain-containing protein n=1 Tax=Chrysochromulina tobinii TaxID=1460289 RepID=A0A0M0K7W1_9EUKA|nr:hypothetical protein Ctob_014464 [Chrysochromulina tobinii]|eukprot:KOO34458.1 hypothetical protein Ctob_014464 [Chrysochromulina sp. CCMP291]